MKNILFRIVLLLFVIITQAQDNATVKTIAEQACSCSKDIDGSLAKDKVIEAINSCIRTKTLLHQLTAVNTETEAARKSGDTLKKTYNITLNDNFKEIQAYLNTNCEVVKNLMAASVGQPLSKNKKAMKFYEEGRSYTDSKMYDMAVVSYNKAVKADPKFATAYDYMGINYRRLGNYNEAINCYKKSLAINPNGMLPLQNLGIAYEYLKDYEQAAATYVEFTKLHPESPEGFYGAGRTLYITGELEQGVDYMMKAYLKYAEVQSPYVNDAKQNLKENYNDLKQKGKLDIFTRAAKNNNIDFK